MGKQLLGPGFSIIGTTENLHFGRLDLHADTLWKDREGDINSRAVCLIPFSTEMQGTVPGSIHLLGSAGRGEEET